jgi:T5SS/PEP-CTERM-associated repeat protein
MAESQLTADFLNIGHQLGTSGTADISGANTLVDTTGGQQYQNVLVGIDGTASLTIEDQATVKTTDLEVAGDFNSGVTDTLDVNNANLFVNQYANIGQGGSASATFSNNADVTAAGLTIGSNTGASGVVMVELLCLGYLDQARLRREGALPGARRRSPFTLAFALGHAWWGNWALEGTKSAQTMLRSADEILAIAMEVASPCISGLGVLSAAGVWAHWGKQRRASR